MSVKLDIRVTREQVAAVLAGNQLGELVGVRALVDPIGGGWHRGFLVAGTVGWAEINKAGGVVATGVWLPVELL